MKRTKYRITKVKGGKYRIQKRVSKLFNIWYNVTERLTLDTANTTLLTYTKKPNET